MRQAIRRATLSFLAGFVATFVIYLFIRFDADDVLVGVVIGAAGGLAVTVAIAYIAYRLGQEDTPPPES